MNQRMSWDLESVGVAHWLIHHAAYQAPDWLSLRLEEEWLADLESRASTASRLRFALGCCWAVVVITHERPKEQTAAWNPSVPKRGPVALAHGSAAYFSLRSGTLFLIVGLLAVLFSGLTVALSQARMSPTVPIVQYQPTTPWLPGHMQ